jgi:hypothetical protein
LIPKTSVAAETGIAARTPDARAIKRDVLNFINCPPIS